MRNWLIVDYGGVLADDRLSNGEDGLARALGASVKIIRSALSEKSLNGRALRLDELSESEFWHAIAVEVNPNAELPSPPEELTKLWACCYGIRLDVADLLRESVSQGLSLGIATNIDKYREHYLLTELEKHSLKAKIWSSYKIGFMKPDVNYFRKIAADIYDLHEQSICFYVDDRQSHVDAASLLGWNTLRADRADLILTWLQQYKILK